MPKPKKPPRNSEPVEVLDETWYLSQVTPALRRRYAAPIRSRARQALIDDRSYALEAAGDDKDARAQAQTAYAEEWERLQDRIDAGEYEWGPPLEMGGIGPGAAISAALATPQGQVRLLQLLLEETHGEISTDQANDLLDANPAGMAAAIRAAMGLPLLPTDPPESSPATPGETAENAEKKSSETAETTATPS